MLCIFCAVLFLVWYMVSTLFPTKTSSPILNLIVSCGSSACHRTHRAKPENTTGRWSIAGHKATSFKLSLTPRANLKSLNDLNVCFWTGGGNWSTQRKHMHANFVQKCPWCPSCHESAVVTTPFFFNNFFIVKQRSNIPNIFLSYNTKESNDKTLKLEQYVKLK